jgi:hypothetical protein
MSPPAVAPAEPSDLAARGGQSGPDEPNEPKPGVPKPSEPSEPTVMTEPTVTTEPSNVESDTWAAPRVTAQHEPEDSRAGVAAVPSEPALDSSTAQPADPVGAKPDDVRADEPASSAI